MYSTRTRGPNVEDQFGALRARVRAHRPRCLVIDPLSALSTKLAHLASADAAQQFLDFLKAEGITVVNTSLMDGISTDEATATGISTIADTWIHVSYVVQDGERNRALTIVKSRGTGHSNQVRELTLSDEGVTLTDVFVAQGRCSWAWPAGSGSRRSGGEKAHPGRGGAQATPAAARPGRGRGAAPGRPDGDGGAQRRDRAPGRRDRDRRRSCWRPTGPCCARCVTPTTRSRSAYKPTRSISWARTAIGESGEMPTTGHLLRLRLYVAGHAPNSLRAIANIQAICDEHFASHHELEVVDLLEQPERALADGIIVTPTLLKLSPLPTQRLIGNLSDTSQVLLALSSR